MNEPVKLLPPSGNLVLLALRIEDSGRFTLLDHRHLDLSHSSVIEPSVAESLGLGIADMAHVFSWWIALRTRFLGSSDPLASSPRSRVRHTSPQATPSST